MRLLRVIRDTRAESGGPVEGLVCSSAALMRSGHEVEVISLDSPAEAASRAFPFPVTGLGRGVGRYGYNSRLTPWIKENARRFDAVILHGIWNYSSFGAWRGLRNQSVPYYIFTHGMMDPWFREHYPFKHLAKSMYWLLCEGRVLGDAAGVLFTSEEERVRARGAFYGPSYNERVVRYGVTDPIGNQEIQIGAFHSTFPRLKGKQFLLFLGRIHPKKGCDLVIQGFSRAINEIAPEMDLVIAGPASSNHIDELKRLSNRLGVSHRTHWLGMLQGDLKWGALRSAEAFILPSHQENFGIAVAEAMACSTPVLISNKVNIWREVEASNGGLVQPDTKDGAFNLVHKFCTLTPEERKRMGIGARDGFLSNFEANVAANDLARTIGFASGASRDRSTSKNILQVIHNTAPESGGPIEAVRRISELLLNEGHHVELASLETQQQVSSRSFPFPAVGLGPSKGRFGYNPCFTKWIRQNAARFDVVILHGLWNYSSVGAWRALRNGSIPYFIYSHGMMDHWFRSRYPLKHLAKQVYWWIAEGWVLRDASEVLFTCEQERMRSRKVFWGHPYRERVVRFGTADPGGERDSERRAFRNAHPELNEKRFLLFLGRIHPKKGCDLLIRAFASTCGQISPELDLVIAGPDQIGWTAELRELANKLGVGSRIHWPGMLKGDLKWGALRLAEALILPSHQENFGIVVAESMACSTPLLISDKVNIWREVVDSQAGLVESDSLEGTRNLISRYSALSDDERTMMRIAARQAYLTHFSMEATASDFLQLIGTL